MGGGGLPAGCKVPKRPARERTEEGLVKKKEKKVNGGEMRGKEERAVLGVNSFEC